MAEIGSMAWVPPISAKLKKGDINYLLKTLNLTNVVFSSPSGDEPLHDLPDDIMVMWVNQV